MVERDYHRKIPKDLVNLEKRGGKRDILDELSKDRENERDKD